MPTTRDLCVLPTLLYGALTTAPVLALLGFDVTHEAEALQSKSRCYHMIR